MRLRRLVCSLSLSLASLAALGTACKSATPEPEAPSERSDFLVTAKLDQEITAPPGATVEIREANLRLRIGAFEDSRCPTRALIQCVWAGSVRVQVFASFIAGDLILHELALETVSGKDTATVFGKRVTLLRVTPEKETIDPIPAETYRFVLRVSNAG